MNVVSPDISKLLAKVVFDISGTNPQILIENLSEGSNLAGCTWWFVINAPGDIPIHEGTESNPDETGNWADATLNDAWPKAFGNILWSGAPYIFYFYVKDSEGNIFYTTQTASICRPAGNTPNSTNTYGLATCLVEVRCQDGRVFFQDTTNATYQGLTGTIGSSVLRVIYPVDETGNVPDPFVATHFSTALVPITYSSDNYQYLSSCIYEYDFGDEVYIRIKYQSFNPVNGSPAVTFAVLCNINLCALFCEVDKLVRQLESGNCANAEEAQQKLNLINPKLWMIVTGIQQPLCGINVPALIAEVTEIGGFDCNCCNAPTGIIPTNGSVIDGYNFTVSTECGDTTGSFNKNGNNIVLTLEGVTYTFGMCDNSPAETTAFNFTKNVEGCLASVCLNVDVTQLSYDILNNIKGDAGLVNLFNSIVVSSGGSFNLVVDGKCIFNSSATYSYVFGLSSIPANTTFAQITGFDVNGVITPLAYSFNMTTLPALQTYLNTLGLGAFTVSATGATSINITSATNSNNINTLYYSEGTLDLIATLTKSATGFTPLSANQVVQMIINYLCEITDEQVVTSAQYEICYIDEGGTQQTQTVAVGQPIAEVLAALSERGCQTIQYILNISGVTCDSMATLFAENENSLQDGDTVLMFKNGVCSRVSMNDLFLKMLQDGLYNNSVITAFCSLVQQCSSGKACTAYSTLYAYLVPYDESCPSIVKFNITYNDSPGVYAINITFANNVSMNQNISIDYKLNNTDIWSVLETSEMVTVSGNTIGVAEVASISGLSTGVYDFRISNLCESPSEYVYLYNVYIENMA